MLPVLLGLKGNNRERKRTELSNYQTKFCRLYGHVRHTESVNSCDHVRDILLTLNQCGLTRTQLLTNSLTVIYEVNCGHFFNLICISSRSTMSAHCVTSYQLSVPFLRYKRERLRTWNSIYKHNDKFKKASSFKF